MFYDLIEVQMDSINQPKFGSQCVDYVWAKPTCQQQFDTERRQHTMILARGSSDLPESVNQKPN
jgi:hypothetical protein